MKVKEVFQQTQQIRIPEKGHPVERSVAHEFLKSVEIDIPIQLVSPSHMKSKKGIFNIAVIDEGLPSLLSEKGISPLPEKDWIFFSIDENQCCWLLSLKPCFLYAAFTNIIENLMEQDIVHVEHWFREMSFSIEKSTFDIFLTQYGRLICNFNREQYIREYARLGFSHIEVNALATPFPFEEGILGEFYPDFYTYAPALDQFVSSQLNQGIYPLDYLQANLNLLKENAQLALQYGLVPGLLCFEPRSVPESLFQRYPTLRGARVDHPFRSLKPRFNLSIVHPIVKKHYAELITNLLKEVPGLGFLTIWTNDSGAGFEHTKSLYVGRNGGAYLIREWKDDEEIAKTAASNIIGFFKLMRDTASQINPRFRVITRLEPFYGERKYLWPELGNRIDVEVNSLLTSGWENNYPHPQYSDVKVLGSAYHNTLREEEKELMEELHSRKSYSFFYHSMSAHTNHEPLLGIPFPWLTYEKLQSSFRQGITTLAHLGGIQPPDKVPYAVNQEVFRLFQFDPKMDIDQAVLAIATKYAGKVHAADLVKGWQLVEQAIRKFIPLPLYSHYGVVWQRLLVRPLVPNIERIPEDERAYYEKFMCSSIHNPNKIDLAKDVLFELVSKDYAHKAFLRIDENVWKSLQCASNLFEEKIDEARRTDDDQALKVFEDQYIRTKALYYFYETLRNTAVWIYAVHAYLDTTDQSLRGDCRKLLDEMIDREIQNSRGLIELFEQAPVEWMILSGLEETPFIHGKNFPKLLEKKISLMEKYKGSEPFIDPGYMFRVVHNPYNDI